MADQANTRAALVSEVAKIKELKGRIQGMDYTQMKIALLYLVGYTQPTEITSDQIAGIIEQAISLAESY